MHPSVRWTREMFCKPRRLALIALQVIGLAEQFEYEMVSPFADLPLFGEEEIQTRMMIEGVFESVGGALTINTKTRKKLHLGHVMKLFEVRLKTAFGREWPLFVG